MGCVPFDFMVNPNEKEREGGCSDVCHPFFSFGCLESDSFGPRWLRWVASPVGGTGPSLDRLVCSSGSPPRHQWLPAAMLLRNRHT